MSLVRVVSTAAAVAANMALLCHAFYPSIVPWTTVRQQRQIEVTTTSTTTTTTTTSRAFGFRLAAGVGGDGRSDLGDAASDLTGTLARLDQVWKIQQRTKPRSRWSKLYLDQDENLVDQVNMGSSSSSGSYSGYSGDDDDENDQDYLSLFPPKSKSQDFVYLLEPPNFSSPSCVIVFLGGAGLGSFPQVAYHEFLTRLSDQMNAAILTAPYGIDMDHFKLSKAVGEKCRKALLQCEEDSSRMYSSKLPLYCLAHSLGGKLAAIYAAATGQEYDGMGLISFNNFGFGDTLSMAKEFAQSLPQSPQRGGVTGSPKGDTLGEIFGMAQTLLGSFGLEFSPSPIDTERLISMRFDDKRIAKTRLFVLDDDNLDDSASFLRACRRTRTTRDGNNGQVVVLPQVSALPGNHLTPVYFQWDLTDLPAEARELAKEQLGGVESASFGSLENLQELVDEICGFLYGREPSRSSTIPLLAEEETCRSG